MGNDIVPTTYFKSRPNRRLQIASELQVHQNAALKSQVPLQTALVYCESQFGLVDGKIAAALVRHSEIYQIVGVIDSELAGMDAGQALGMERKGIPIFLDMDEALASLPDVPDCLIYGKAPLEACIPNDERFLIFEAMKKGMDIINGLHQFFSEDQEFVMMATHSQVQIKDIRKPPPLNDLHVFSGRIKEVTIPVVAVLGTDCACGKMTTAVELNKALNSLGKKSVLVATGQTALMQGAKYGTSIDAVVSQFVIGEVENAVVNAFYGEQPDIILVEGQSSLGHPAFMSSVGILKGSMPDGIILQHPPGRSVRCDFPHLAMPSVESEIQLLEAFSGASVLAIALSHENLSDSEVISTVEDYERVFQLPTADVLSSGCQKIIQALSNRFPSLQSIRPVKGTAE